MLLTLFLCFLSTGDYLTHILWILERDFDFDLLLETLRPGDLDLPLFPFSSSSLNFPILNSHDLIYVIRSPVIFNSLFTLPKHSSKIFRLRYSFDFDSILRKIIWYFL